MRRCYSCFCISYQSDAYETPLKRVQSFVSTPHLQSHLPLNVFGCIAFVQNHSQNRSKLDLRDIKCIFVGYSPTKKGYKCYESTTRKNFVSLDVNILWKHSLLPKPFPLGKINIIEDRNLVNTWTLISPLISLPLISLLQIRVMNLITHIENSSSTYLSTLLCLT